MTVGVSAGLATTIVREHNGDNTGGVDVDLGF